MPARESKSKTMLHSLGEAIVMRRQWLRMSQQELADRSGIDRAAISNIERGKRNPSFSALVKLSAGLSMRLSRLMTNAERMHGQS